MRSITSLSLASSFFFSSATSPFSSLASSLASCFASSLASELYHLDAHGAGATRCCALRAADVLAATEPARRARALEKMARRSILCDVFYVRVRCVCVCVCVAWM